MADRKRLVDVAYEKTLTLITTVASPGLRLSEGELAVEYGMSKTPVREALGRLESEGLLISIPHVGYLIPQVSYRDIREVFEVREAFEGYAANLAAERMSDETLTELQKQSAAIENHINGKGPVSVDLMKSFGGSLHGAILESADNATLNQMLDGVRVKIQRAISPAEVSDAVRHRKSFFEHTKILQALSKDERDLAEQAMKAHVRSVGFYVLNRFR